MIMCGVFMLISYTFPPQLHQDNVLQFIAKSFSSSPLNVTREIYTSLGRPFMYSSLFELIKVFFS